MFYNIKTLLQWFRWTKLTVVIDPPFCPTESYTQCDLLHLYMMTRSGANLKDCFTLFHHL